MTFHDAAFLLARPLMENRIQAFADFAEHHLTPIFGHEHGVIRAVPLRVRQALIEFRPCFFLLRIG
jgi:hypothetical protein